MTAADRGKETPMPDALTPLDRALAHVVSTPRPGSPSEGDIELAIAWAQGRVATSQAAVGFGFNKTKLGVYTRLSQCFRAAIQSGVLKV